MLFIEGVSLSVFLAVFMIMFEIKKTIVTLAENLKVIAEPGGAVAAAALLNKKLNVENKTIIVMISGGNIDSKLFSSIAKEKND